MALCVLLSAGQARADESTPLVGRVVNVQRQPVAGITVTLTVTDAQGGHRTLEAISRADGWFVLGVPPGARAVGSTLTLQRRHYSQRTVRLDAAQRAALQEGRPVSVGDLPIQRRKTAAFWVTVGVFLLMMLLIGTTRMHNALAALLGASLLLAASAVGQVATQDLVVYSFNDALDAVDWNVVFLIMGMMMVIAVVEGTGVFRWLAFFAYKSSGGKLWKLVAILMLITALSSALLDNVTTMLLVTPITIRIALAIDVDPLTLLFPEVLAANVGGLSTMVGTPTNILIASYSGISFAAFLLNLTPGVVLALVGIWGYSTLRFKRQLAARDGDVSAKLLERLEQGATIAQPGHLRKSGWVGLGMLALFIGGEHLHIPPAMIALLGATSLLVWIRPNVEEMIEAVDWTTLIFFITLFMVVGALQEVGLIDQIAVWVSRLVGDSQLLAMVVITWLSALISTVIPNIPFTATMLPVIGYLTSTMPGVDPKSLYFCLAVGAAMGGNGSLVGASANLVTAGIAERSGYPITFGHFFRVGFPALLVSVSLAFLWLLVRYMVF
jgi:Na+/H+ antiporter NhaD/arsenite permease-like protein